MSAFQRQKRRWKRDMAMSMKGSVMQLMRMASCMGRKSAVTGTAKSAAPMAHTPDRNPPRHQVMAVPISTQWDERKFMKSITYPV